MAQASVKEPIANIKLQTPFELYNFNSVSGCREPSQVVTTNRAELIKLFEEMWRVRRMEMAADALYKGKLIRGFCHLGIGQVNKDKWGMNGLFNIHAHKLLIFISIGGYSSGHGSGFGKRRCHYNCL